MPQNIDIDTQCNLFKIKKPYQYIGSEYLSYNNNWDDSKVKIALAFPDKYEIAISNLGQKILYSLVNSKNGFLADRVYASDLDYKELLESENIDLSTLDNKKPLGRFDFVGFSLQYEMAYPTVLKMLDLAKIPVKCSERKENHPIIMAGGPCCYNPNPMSAFIDIFMIGDGEDIIIDILSKYKELKEKSTSRTEIIRKLSEIEGVYSPEFPNKTKKKDFSINKRRVPGSKPNSLFKFSP